MAQLQRLAITPTQIHNQQIALTPQQQHYLSHVLRLRQGDHFIGIDGVGQSWLATLAGSSAQIIEALSVQTELPILVTLMVALPKGNAFDDVVRSCTELGVYAIAPVMSDRTLLNPSPQKVERWRRIATEAAEQSERQIVPLVLDPLPLATSISSMTPDAQRYLCVARGNVPHLWDSLQSGAQAEAFHASKGQSPSIAIATGPEGGWTPTEIEQAIATGFKPVSLGRRILRAVTAPVVALSITAAAVEHNFEL
ncbi:MAG: 16S rRNA (uracil(1498)-N(3))-methyltransferase [Aphanothece sp. CMT-3BRIN-NPC111]|nr:16S rRNA (uracil(1498)-N(3))-methyltransferase [Aphanothece sp. CMT-3BRIN-NPC111]